MFWLAEQLGGVLVILFGLWLGWQIFCWLVDLVSPAPEKR